MILLVDDEEMMVDVTKRILGLLGFAVVAKTSSIDALEAFQEEPDEFDLVITDQVMPNMTGTQLAKNLISKQTSYNPWPIIEKTHVVIVKSLS